MWQPLTCCWVTKSCLTLCDPMVCSIPLSSVLHYLLEFAQIHIHWVDYVILTISSSITPFSVPQSFPVTGSFFSKWSFWFFALGGQNTRASASVLLVNIKDWFPLGLTGLISLKFKGLSRVFSTTVVWKHPLVFNLCGPVFSHLYMTTRKKHSFDITDLCWQSDVSAF